MNRIFDDYYTEPEDIEKIEEYAERNKIFNLGAIHNGGQFEDEAAYKNYMSERFAPLNKAHFINYYK